MDTPDGVRTYAVVGLGPRRSSLEAYGKRPSSRFVGRERELAELHHRLSRVERGRGQIVGIIGEPGVGKSRLCYEVSQMLRTHGWLILETSPVAYGQDISYFPVVDLFKTYFPLDAGDAPRTMHDKIMPRKRKPITGKPWHWPKNLACAHCRRTATSASAVSTRRLASRSGLAPGCPRPSIFTVPWT
jgi:AAA ATPase domain